MERKMWTAEELMAMTPAERSKISREAEISDPSEFPELFESAREFVLERIASEEEASTS